MVCAPFFVATNAPVSQANFNVDMRSVFLIIPAASIALNASPLPVASTSVTLDGV